MGGLSMVAQVLAALFVLVSGIWSLLAVAGVNLGATGTLAVTGLVGVLGLLGGLAWLATAVKGGK